MASEQTISIAQLIRAIRRLPSDEPHGDPGTWYKTQKEHWLGWLSEYDGPGAYGRRSGNKRHAEFACNHIVQPKMLFWLIEAAGVRSHLVSAARGASAKAGALQQKSAAIRRHVPWEELASVLWVRD
jgi:hypothetical protein